MPIRQKAVTDEDDDEALIARDYVLARAAVALAALDSAKAEIIEMTSLFVTPDDDKKGKARREALDNAIESASIATRALEDAMENFSDADLEAPEPWEEIDDDPDGAS